LIDEQVESSKMGPYGLPPLSQAHSGNEANCVKASVRPFPMRTDSRGRVKAEGVGLFLLWLLIWTCDMIRSRLLRSGNEREERKGGKEG
jgi:hypothetical protein